MAPTRKKSVNKPFLSEVSPDKEVRNSNKNRQLVTGVSIGFTSRRFCLPKLWAIVYVCVLIFHCAYTSLLMVSLILYILVVAHLICLWVYVKTLNHLLTYLQHWSWNGCLQHLWMYSLLFFHWLKIILWYLLIEYCIFFPEEEIV